MFFHIPKLSVLDPAYLPGLIQKTALATTTTKQANYYPLRFNMQMNITQKATLLSYLSPVCIGRPRTVEITRAQGRALLTL